ncbi:hypothetical protein ACLEQD_43990, partial [Corallococcus sp. 4LFB]
MLMCCSLGISAIPMLWLLPTAGTLWPLLFDVLLAGSLWSGHGLAIFALPLTWRRAGPALLPGGVRHREGQG